MRWPWSRSEPAPSEVRDSLERLEGKMRALQLEQAEMHDKVRRAMFRAIKTKGEVPAEEAEPVDPRYAHLDPVSRRIVMARKGRRNGEG